MLILILLPMLALAAQADDLAYECQIERSAPRGGTYVASRVFPANPSGNTNVMQV